MRLILIAFCLGIWLLQQQAALPPTRWLWALPLLSAILLLPRFTHPPFEIMRLGGVALLSVALGFAWAAWRADARLAERLPAHWQGVDVEIVGVVSDLPHANARGERFVFDVERVLTPGVSAIRRVQLTRYWPRGADPRPTIHAAERWHSPCA